MQVLRRAAGNSEGLGIPSALGSWFESIAGANVLYGGEAPSFLAGRLYVEVTTSSDDPSYSLLVWNVATILQHFLFCKW